MEAERNPTQPSKATRRDARHSVQRERFSSVRLVPVVVFGFTSAGAVLLAAPARTLVSSTAFPRSSIYLVLCLGRLYNSAYFEK